MNSNCNSRTMHVKLNRTLTIKIQQTTCLSINNYLNNLIFNLTIVDIVVVVSVTLVFVVGF